jgi:hypothetical protein
MRDGTVAGFKYFDCKGITKIGVKTRAYAIGQLEIKTAWDGPALGSVSIGYSNIWVEASADVKIPDGVNALYFEFKGEGGVSLASFDLRV